MRCPGRSSNAESRRLARLIFGGHPVKEADDEAEVVGDLRLFWFRVCMQTATGRSHADPPSRVCWYFDPDGTCMIARSC